MTTIAEALRLLWGTVLYRPYVYAFLACFLAFAVRQLGVRRAFTFALPTWAIAFAAEYSSTRNGFPFGSYTYFDATRTRELWISNVPFWDSLSFVFLSYFSLALAAAALSPRGALAEAPWPGLRARGAPLLGGLLMTLLDVVIDPVTLQGEKWFLGRIYAYPGEGFWFGVTAANFAGWFAVGASTQWLFQRCLEWLPWCRGPWRPVSRRFAWAVLATYAGVLCFMLAVTVAIGDRALAIASAAVTAATLAPLAWTLRPAGAPACARVLVCTPTRVEARACRRGIADARGRSVEVLRTGVGPWRAAAALAARLRAGPRPALVVSSGFAGALTPGLPLRTLVTAATLHRLDGRGAVPVPLPEGALVPAPGAVPCSVASAAGVLLGGSRRLPAPAAVDMESVAIAETAAAAGIPVAVLRVVTDTPAAPFPPIAAALAEALAAGSPGVRLGAAARAAAAALRRPADAVAFARASLAAARALRAAWCDRAHREGSSP